MNVCLIGYGSIARYHVEALRGEGATLHTVVGRLPEQCAEFAREHGFRRHTADLDEALAAPEVDAVVVTSPTDLHFEHAEKALRAGKHVLCEIPLATSLAQVDRLIALADQMDRRLMVCHTQRYYPGFRLARQMVAEGGLRAHHVVYRYCFLRRENVNWTGRRRSWTDNLLWHHGCHVVDTALWLLGATEAQVVSQVARPGGALGIPMDLGMVLQTPLGQLVTIAMSYNSHVRADDCLIVGEEDTLLYSGHRLTAGARVVYEPAPGVDTLARGVAGQDREFVAAVREGRGPAVSGRAVRPAMSVLQAVRDQLDRGALPGGAPPVG